LSPELCGTQCRCLREVHAELVLGRGLERRAEQNVDGSSHRRPQARWRRIVDEEVRLGIRVAYVLAITRLPSVFDTWFRLIALDQLACYVSVLVRVPQARPRLGNSSHEVTFALPARRIERDQDKARPIDISERVDLVGVLQRPDEVCHAPERAI